MTKDKKHHHEHKGGKAEEHHHGHHDTPSEEEKKEEAAPDNTVEFKKEEDAGKPEEKVAEVKNEELEKNKALAKDYLNQLQRLQAEFDNYRKREEKNKLGLKDFVIQNTMKDFLPFVDNFERALIAAENQNVTLESLKEGIKLVFQQLESFLNGLSIKRIAAQGKIFNPNLHDGVSKIYSDEAPEDTVLQVLQNGWIMNEATVLRPAMVVVSGGKAPGEKPKEEAAKDENVSGTQPLNQ